MIYVLFGFPVPPIQSETSLFNKMWRLLLPKVLVDMASMLLCSWIGSWFLKATPSRNEEFDLRFC
jgi:hypothetical protein